MQIQWNEKFATGNRLVDRQHQSLFEAVNAFDRALEDGMSPERMDETLDFLTRYVREHFSTEEFLMLSSSFPNLALHKGEHDRLLTRVKFIRDLRDQDPGLVPPEGLARFLGDWLQGHILGWDLAFFDYLREHPLESAPQ